MKPISRYSGLLAAMMAFSCGSADRETPKPAAVAKVALAVSAAPRVAGSALLVAGQGTPGYAGDGASATAALLNEPSAIAVATDGTVFIADTANNCIRTVSAGVIETFGPACNPNLLVNGNFETLAPGGVLPAAWTPATQAWLGKWSTLSVAGSASVVAVDGLRVLSPDGASVISQDVDLSARSAAVDAGNLVLRVTAYARADSPTKQKVSVRLHALNSSNSVIGFTDALTNPAHWATKEWVQLSTNYRLPINTKRVRVNVLVDGAPADFTTASRVHIDDLMLRELPSSGHYLSEPQGLALDSDGFLYVADTGNNRIVALPSATDQPMDLAGTSGVEGFSATLFRRPTSIAVEGSAFDSTGAVYVADWGNHRIRKITNGGANGMMLSTLAGDGTRGSTDSPVRFNYPRSVAFRFGASTAIDGIVVADSGSFATRLLSKSGTSTSTLDGTLNQGQVSPGTNDRLKPADSSGKLWGPTAAIELPAPDRLRAGGRFIADARGVLHGQSGLLQTLTDSGAAPNAPLFELASSGHLFAAGLALGPDRSIYASERFGNKVWRLVCVDADRCQGEPRFDAAQNKCVVGPPQPLDDHDRCTSDECDWPTGPRHDRLLDGASCSDGNQCNGTEKCDASGVCKPGTPLVVTDDGNPCTIESCDAALGLKRTQLAAGTPCGGGDCRTSGVCDGAGTCVGSAVLAPDDRNSCTSDRCDASQGVVHSPIAGSCGAAGQCVVGTCVEPTLISTLVPSLPVGTPASPNDLVAHVYSGTNPVQIGVAPTTIEPTRASGIRGRVFGENGLAKPGVTILVVNHPEYGSTKTGSFGEYDLVVNGGGPLTLRYQAANYLPLDRAVNPAWNEPVAMEDVHLIKPDVATPIALGTSSTPQSAWGSTVSDSAGTRQSGVFFPSDTRAHALLADGVTQQELNGLSVRITEYTVGPDGRKRMPAPVAPNTIYTYAAEFSVDEALAKAANTVLFSRPVVIYVDDFVGIAAGQPVPAGYYDRDKLAWMPSTSGQVVSITGYTATKRAILDASASPLNVPAEELDNIGQHYFPRLALLMRVPITHFTPVDLNLSKRLPPCEQIAGKTICPSGLGGQPEAVAQQPQNGTCSLKGSIIGAEEQSLGESLGVAGTPYTLNYDTRNVWGYTAGRSFDLPIAPGQHSMLRRFEVSVLVAEEHNNASFFPPFFSGPWRFTWNGYDGYGRKAFGTHTAQIVVDAVYPEFSGPPGEFGTYSGQSGETVLQGRDEIRLRRVFKQDVSSWDASSLGLGGWTLSAHHVYDRAGKMLYLGTGQRRKADGVTAVISALAGNGTRTSAADGAAALASGLNYPNYITVGPNGDTYVTLRDDHVVRRIDTRGRIYTLAGTRGSAGFGGENVAATSALLNSPSGVAVGPDERVYISDSYNHRIRRVDKDGKIVTIAGSATQSGQPSCAFSGDGGPATAAKFCFPLGLTVASDGTIYVADSGNHRIRKIDTRGKISTVAGNGQTSDPPGFAAEGVFATSVALNPLSDVALGPDGSLWTPAYNNLIQITLEGKAHYIKLGERNVLATNSIGVARDGAVYFGSTGGGQNTGYEILKMNVDETFTRVAGGLGSGKTLDGAVATSTKLEDPYQLALAPDGSVYVTGWASNTVYRVHQDVPGGGPGCEVAVPSEDQRELYCFDAKGVHQSTRNPLSGATLLGFSYQQGLLSKITDSTGRGTLIIRAADGSSVAVKGPDAQVTTIGIDSTTGYATYIEDPLHMRTLVTHSSTGLLQSLKDRNGQVYTFTYDSDGRLTRDTDPALGFQLFTKSPAGTLAAPGYSVSRVTAMSRATMYTILPLENGGERKEVTFGGLLKNTVDIGRDLKQQISFADGTQGTSTRAPDPRWGSASSYVNSVSMKLPSGLTRTESLLREVTGGAGDSPVTQLKDTLSVNGVLARTNTFDSATSAYGIETGRGRKSKYTEDALGRITGISVAGVAKSLSIHRDSLGRIDATQFGDRASSYTYYQSTDTTPGYVRTATDGLAHGVTFVPDNRGRILNQTRSDSLSHTTQNLSFVWDGESNLTGLTPPGKKQHTLSYTPVGLLSAYTAPAVPGLSNITTYGYNKDRQLESIVRPDPATITLAYDPVMTRLSKVITPTGSIEVEYYDGTKGAGLAPGHIKKIAGPGSSLISFTNDGELATNKTYAGDVAGSISWSYDANFRTNTETVSARGVSQVATYGYDTDGVVTCVSLGSCAATDSKSLQLIADPQNARLVSSTLNKITDSFGYNDYGEIASYVARGTSELYSVVYDLKSSTTPRPRDALGRVRFKSESFNGAAAKLYEYIYDDFGRLVEVKDGTGSVTNHYDYDLNGNRIAARTASASITAAQVVIDDQDRLLTYGDKTFTYNANGDLESKVQGGAVTRYVYDALGNLRQVTLPDATRIDYTIDGLGRRTTKSINGVVTKRWLYGKQIGPIAELDAAGNIVSRFVWGTRQNVPDFMLKNGAIYRIISDQLGSVRMIVDASTGAVAQRMEHDEFGIKLTDSAPGFQPFGFAGGLYDPDTTLVRFGVRDYDPSIGRWVSKDPILFGGGQSNLYAYVDGDPVNRIDSNGRFWKSTLGGSMAGFGLTLLTIGLVSNPVGWAIVGVGTALVIWDAIEDKIVGPLDTIDRAKERLTPVDDYNRHQEEQLRELEECEKNGWED